MKRLLFLFLILPCLAGGEPDLRKQLSDALYAEEVTRDSAAAADAYEKILAEFDQQRPLAASALFRLAEVRRKQDRNDDAIALYQRLLREFSDAESEVKLAQQNLVALGAEAPKSNREEDSRLTKEIRHYEEMAQQRPDIFKSASVIREVIGTGNLELVKVVLALGSNPTDGLESAAGYGYLEILKLLVQEGADLTGREGCNALSRAIVKSSGPLADLQTKLKMCSYLLESGVSLEKRTFDGENWNPLVDTVATFEKDVCSLLLEKGADIDGFSKRDGEMVTPLMYAIIRGNLSAFRFLIERGADVRLVNSETGGTALLTAMFTNPQHQVEIVRELLKQGANVNGSLKGEIIMPLHIALAMGHKQGSALLVELVKYKVNPDQRAQVNPLKDESGPYRFDGETPLNIALKLGDERKLEILLDAGASITAENILWSLQESSDRRKFRDLFLAHLPSFESGDEKASEVLELVAKRGLDIVPLLEKGATPSKKWQKSFFRGAREEGLRILNEEFLYPELASGEGMTLFQPRWGTLGPSLTILAEKSQWEEIPSLEDLLLSQPPELWFWSEGNERELATKWTIWRKNAAGELEANSFDVASDDSLPELHWGDLLEIRVDELDLLRKNGMFLDQEEVGKVVTKKSQSLLWNLRKRIKIPIKVTVGESTREMTLRGDRLAYDPTLHEAPLVDIWRLVSLIHGRRPMSLTIRREGVSDVILRRGPIENPQFTLQPNDHLILSEPATESESLDAQQRFIRVQIPGNLDGFYWHFVPEPELAPTLVELLAAVYAPRSQPASKEYAAHESRFLGELTEHLEASVRVPVIFPHPDFENLRIRRVNRDGEESLLEVDLAAAIESCTVDTTGEEARRLDVGLQVGDILELPLMRVPEPWTGFTASQVQFFRKVLSGTFQQEDKEGQVSLRTIDWAPIDWTPSPGGLLHLSPEKGVVSTRVRDVLGSMERFDLNRGGEEFERYHHFYLRNGDQIRPSSKKAKSGRSSVAPEK